ncbi:MAG: hypothetical protein M1522_01695 [Actinobacteria bacterium]|nr:hypothetical protein [Actinomycetota bacterium]
MDIRVGPASVTIHMDDEVLVCDSDAKMSSDQEQGYFARDTRFVSGYRLKLGGTHPLLLNSSATEPSSSRFELTNPELQDSSGPVPAQSLHLRLDRAIGHGVHEDYDVTNYSGRRVVVDLEVSVECDFADLFDVKAHRRVRRGILQSTWEEKAATLLDLAGLHRLTVTATSCAPYRFALARKARRRSSRTAGSCGAWSWIPVPRGIPAYSGRSTRGPAACCIQEKSAMRSRGTTPCTADCVANGSPAQHASRLTSRGSVQ